MWTLPVSQLDLLLDEDVPGGDLTTDSLGIGELPGRLAFAARGPMTVAGIEVAEQLLVRCGAAVQRQSRSGDRVAAGASLLTATGPAASLHRGWKVSQTLVEILSGIATAARRLVDAAAAADPTVRIACTRKSFPGARRLSHLAVKAGGAVLHRHGLSETVLLFRQHRAFLGGQPLAETARRLREAAPEKKIVIEADDVAMACEAVLAGFDVVQLDKFAPADVAAVAAFVQGRPHPPVVASTGGLNPDNVADHIRAGARLVITSWPYTARPADVAVTIGPPVDAA